MSYLKKIKQVESSAHKDNQLKEHDSSIINLEGENTERTVFSDQDVQRANDVINTQNHPSLDDD